MFLMSGLLSFFTVCSVFFPSSRAAVDQCQSSVCWGEMCVLRRSANEAQPAKRWSCCGVTFDLQDTLSLSLGCLWRGRGAPRSPRGSSWGQSEEPRASVLLFLTSTPTNRPAAGGRRRRRRKGAKRRGESLISLSLCFHQQKQIIFLWTRTIGLPEERPREAVVEEILRYFTKVKVAIQLWKNTPLQVIVTDAVMWKWPFTVVVGWGWENVNDVINCWAVSSSQSLISWRHISI